MFLMENKNYIKQIGIEPFFYKTLPPLFQKKNALAKQYIANKTHIMIKMSN